MRKNPHGRILKMEPKEQHLSTVPKFYSFKNIPNLMKNPNPVITLHIMTQIRPFPRVNQSKTFTYLQTLFLLPHIKMILLENLILMKSCFHFV